MTSTQLDRRRDRSEATAARAGEAHAKIAELENRLQANADLTRQQTQALRTAEAEVKRLKRALKGQKDDRDRLLKAKTKATAKAKTAERRAATAEGKYDKSVLADLVHREKERDRAAAKGRQGTHAAPVALPAAGGGGSAAELPAAASARETAARTTADEAG